MMMTGELERQCSPVHLFKFSILLLISPGRAVAPLKVTNQQCGRLPLSHQMEID